MRKFLVPCDLICDPIMMLFYVFCRFIMPKFEFYTQNSSFCSFSYVMTKTILDPPWVRCLGEKVCLAQAHSIISRGSKIHAYWQSDFKFLEQIMCKRDILRDSHKTSSKKTPIGLACLWCAKYHTHTHMRIRPFVMSNKSQIFQNSWKSIHPLWLHLKDSIIRGKNTAWRRIE